MLENKIYERILTMKSTVHFIVRRDISCKKQKCFKKYIIHYQKDKLREISHERCEKYYYFNIESVIDFFWWRKYVCYYVCYYVIDLTDRNLTRVYFSCSWTTAHGVNYSIFMSFIS